jgi:hypothetical protein
MTDEHPGGVQSWTETMSARERIRSVALTLSEPRSTNWISDQAETAWSTTNQELDDLVDRGQLHGIKEKAHDFSRGMNTTIHHTNHERLESLSLPR